MGVKADYRHKRAPCARGYWLSAVSYSPRRIRLLADRGRQEGRVFILGVTRAKRSQVIGYLLSVYPGKTRGGSEDFRSCAWNLSL